MSASRGRLLALRPGVTCTFSQGEAVLRRAERRVTLEVSSSAAAFLGELAEHALPREAAPPGFPVDELIALGLLLEATGPASLQAQEFHARSAAPLNVGEALSDEELLTLEQVTRARRFSAAPPAGGGMTVPPGLFRTPSHDPGSFDGSVPAFEPDELEKLLGTWHDDRYRLHPSAGALYPIRLVVEQRHHGRTAFSWFDPATQTVVTREAELQGTAFATDETLAKAATRVWFVGDLEHVSRKYGPRGYRYTLLEAGHAAQCLIQLLTWHGLGARPYGGFHDEEAAKRLELANHEVVAYVVAVERNGVDRIAQDWLLGLETKYAVLDGQPVHYTVGYGGKDEGGESVYGFGFDPDLRLSQLKCMGELAERLALIRLAAELPNSNGMAAHPYPRVAEESAMLELYERHCLLRVWLLRAATDEVRPPSGRAATLLDYLVRRGDVRFALKDISDPTLGVPAIAGVAWHPDHGGILTSSAAARTEAQAAEKCMLELAKALYHRLIVRKADAFEPTGPQVLAGPEDHEEYYANTAVDPAKTRFLVEAREIRDASTVRHDLARLEALCTLRDASELGPDPRRFHIRYATSDQLVALHFGPPSAEQLARAGRLLGVESWNADPHPIG